MTSKAARFGAAMAMLLAAHDLADHVVQTDHQAAEKARDWSAMAGHVGGYTAVQVGALAALSAATGERSTWGRTVAAVAVSAVSHAFLDRRWPVRRALELTGSPSFAQTLTPICGPYVTDQALHHVCLTISALILAGGSR